MPQSGRGVRRTEFTAVLGLLLVPSCFFVTRQSLWIDEATSCWFADHSRHLNPGEFHFLGALAQMPVFHLLLIAWVRVVGDSEPALRSINLPFAALFLGAILYLCHRSGERGWWLPAVPFAVFPLLTYYVNECRPYTALLALSTAAGVALFAHLRTGSRGAAYCCSFFCLAAFGMHLLGIMAPLILLSFVLLDRDARDGLRRSWRQWVVPLLLSMPGYLLLGVYYLHTKAEGISHGQALANPDTPGNQASTWKNVAFFFYEALGFDGLGPPRNVLRIHARLQMFGGTIGLMLLGVAACVALGVVLSRAWKVDGVKAWTAASMAGLALLFVVARVIHFGFFGRHAMAIAGTLCCCAVVALTSKRVSSRSRIAAVAMLSLAWGVSSARLLLLYPYGKDDVRGALNAAKAAGTPILWDADIRDAAYYGAYDLEGAGPEGFGRPPVRATEHWQHTTPVHLLAGSGQSDVDQVVRQFGNQRCIFVSGKADQFDPAGVWARTVAGWQPILLNRLNGFDVWMVTPR